jgi:hypothetical protein
MSTTRYSAFERGEVTPSELDRELIERFLPELDEQTAAELSGSVPGRVVSPTQPTREKGGHG